MVRLYKQANFIIIAVFIRMLLLKLDQFCLRISNSQIVNRGIRHFYFAFFLSTRPWRGPVQRLYRKKMESSRADAARDTA